MSKLFSVLVTARDYEVDSNGHVAGSVLLQFGQHARWSCLREAGIDPSGLSSGHGPISIEETIRYHRELLAGEEVEITCTFGWPGGKTFRVAQEIRKSDGTLVAEITGVGGILDLDARRLLPDPASVWRSEAGRPEVLGIGQPPGS